MWTNYFRNRVSDDTCSHDHLTETANYGLQRTVCGDCGQVSVGYLHDIFEERQQRRQLDADEATASS